MGEKVVIRKFRSVTRFYPAVGRRAPRIEKQRVDGRRFVLRGRRPSSCGTVLILSTTTTTTMLKDRIGFPPIVGTSIRDAIVSAGIS